MGHFVSQGRYFKGHRLRCGLSRSQLTLGLVQGRRGRPRPHPPGAFGRQDLLGTGAERGNLGPGQGGTLFQARGQPALGQVQEPLVPPRRYPLVLKPALHEGQDLALGRQA